MVSVQQSDDPKPEDGTLIREMEQAPPPPVQERGRLPWTRTDLDALSTFAADVDTASWTRIRSELEYGRIPHRSTVRVEEVVNAFPYDYRAPTDEVFRVDVEGVPSVFEEGATLVRIGVQGRRVPPHLRKRVHLTFLVDVSGSMSGRSLELVREGLRMLVHELRPDDTVAIVTYAGSTGVLLEPTSDEESILAALDRLKPGGGTAMGSGIELAYGLARGTLDR